VWKSAGLLDSGLSLQLRLTLDVRFNTGRPEESSRIRVFLGTNQGCRMKAKEQFRHLLEHLNINVIVVGDCLWSCQPALTGADQNRYCSKHKALLYSVPISHRYIYGTGFYYNKSFMAETCSTASSCPKSLMDQTCSTACHLRDE
jgi:hypothetical protein